MHRSLTHSVRRPRIRAAVMLGVGLTALLAGVTAAGPVFAADRHPARSASGMTAYAPGAPQAVAARTQAVAAAVPCWTSFNPPTPQGGAMDQTYNNCGVGSTVAPGYIQNGNIHVYTASCIWLNSGDTVVWHYGATIPNVTYTTITCDT
jgi:hypothetical protein